MADGEGDEDVEQRAGAAADGQPEPPSAAQVFAAAFEGRGADAVAPSVEEVPEVPGAFVIRGALSESETDALATAVRLAHVSHLPRRDDPAQQSTTRRDSQHHKPVRVSVDCMMPLCSRLRPFLPAVAGPNCAAALAEAGLEVSGHLRCYRYLPGDSSRPHFDRSFTRAENNVQKAFSAYSILLYLTDSCESAGGHTTFFAPDEKLQVSRDGLTVLQERHELSVAASVTPCRGDVLVFPHGNYPGCHPNPLHEGSPVLSGCKSLIRTDAIYTCPPPRNRKQGKAVRPKVEPDEGDV
mmetsp:Transcript_37911/g.100292  ORF Transcript_37911/g.100292 Transcript_37911/m.100292 type:complete len:296 (-) Transcript_37911:104-991(-)